MRHSQGRIVDVGGADDELRLFEERRDARFANQHSRAVNCSLAYLRLHQPTSVVEARVVKERQALLARQAAA